MASGPVSNRCASRSWICFAPARAGFAAGPGPAAGAGREGVPGALPPVGGVGRPPDVGVLAEPLLEEATRLAEASLKSRIVAWLPTIQNRFRSRTEPARANSAVWRPAG